MAEVFEATIQGAGGFTRKVAIKRLRADLAADPALVEAFVNEARLLSQLHHASIISVVDFGLMDELPFQVLELVDGLDLVGLAAAAERSGSLVAPELWLAVVAEAAHALEYAHQARDDQGRPLGIVHRDVSPGNILVSWAGDVKLGDFGIASSLAQRGQTKVGTALGKLEYMAPEQHLGSGVDPRTDVFSLGCVLHRMLVGHSPIATVDARTKILSGVRVNVDPSLPPDLAKIVQRAIDPDRSRRHSSAAQLASECTKVIARLSEDDGRTLLRAWLGRLRPKEERAARSPLAELMNAELVLSPAQSEEAPLRRYTSTLQRATSLVAIGDELSPAGPTVHATAAAKPEFADQFITDPAPGAIAGEYEIFELLGTGGFAFVYRAKHLPSGRELALKLLRTDSVASPTSTRRFAREAQALASLSHPNLVRIADSGLTPDGRPYLAMELVRGSTLLQALREAGSFTLERARNLAGQLAEGLAEVHARGYVHRDLKPKNVMLVPHEGGETVKILDFGLTRLLDPDSELTHLTTMGFQLGTARWMAPEQIRDPSNVGPGADLYALGLILYSMIAGRPPFAGTADEVLHQHLESPPPALPEAGALSELIERLLAKDPGQRPQSARAVAAMLASIDLGATQLEMAPTRGEFALEVKTAAEEAAGSGSGGMNRPAGTVDPHNAWAGEDEGEQLGTPTTPLRSARASPGPAAIVPRPVQVRVLSPGPKASGLSRELVIVGSLLLFSFALAVTLVLRGGRAELPTDSVEVLELPRATPIASVTPSPEVKDPIEPVAPVEPDPPRPTRAPARPEPSPRSDPRAQVQAKVSELGPSLTAALAERGISMGDLELNPASRQASRQWKSAVAGHDPAAVEVAHRALLREVSGFAIDSAALTALLESAREAMSDRALTEAGRARLPEFEKRYLDLRARASGAEGVAALSLARQIRRLELELRAP